jgi:hypothetical protein
MPSAATGSIAEDGVLGIVDTELGTMAGTVAKIFGLS